ncbi:MAG TPA: hypothetical protein PKD79_04075 [Candidatus Doudnabacteria bacterium]|nr:hypothetical protein [Candidatus Doudnabacteria bacterium]
MLTILSETIKDVLFPKQCFGCRSWGLFICENCRTQLANHKFLRCIICQKPSLGGWTHPKCRGKYRPERLITIFDYQDEVISQLINTGKLALVPDIFLELTETAYARVNVVQPNLWSFVLCPIPQTKSKTRWRGFNQSELIAQVLSLKLNLVVDRALIKIRFTKQQKELNKLGRAANLKNAFRFTGGSIPTEVILVDDITTTGSTFLEASKVLKRAGVHTVWCLALAQD